MAVASVLQSLYPAGQTQEETRELVTLMSDAVQSVRQPHRLAGDFGSVALSSGASALQRATDMTLAANAAGTAAMSRRRANLGGQSTAEGPWWNLGLVRLAPSGAYAAEYLRKSADLFRLHGMGMLQDATCAAVSGVVASAGLWMPPVASALLGVSARPLLEIMTDFARPSPAQDEDDHEKID